MFEFNVCTGLFRKTLIGGSDHGLEFATGFDFVPGSVIDCNFNQLTDDCDIASGFSADANGNNVPDECELDCNANGTFDRLDLIPFGPSYDCNCNGVPDECDITAGLSTDCNGDGRLDECEPDCNGNGEADGCDILNGFSLDCDDNSVPDECDPDYNANGKADGCDILNGDSIDCDGNGVPDECDPDCNGNGESDGCDIVSGYSIDCDGNGVPDECDPDCNNNTIADTCDLASGFSQDCDENGVPDECQIDSGSSAPGGPFFCTSNCSPDCNETGIPDACELVGSDCNNNAVPDECEFVDCNTNGEHDTCDIASGVSSDCNQNGIPDECEFADCNTNDANDSCDIASGASTDRDGNGVPDECDSDCNANGRPDAIDILDGFSADCTGNGVPDECECDCNQNGQADSCDIADGLVEDCNANGVPDACDTRLIGEGISLPSITVPDGLEATIVASGLNEPWRIIAGQGAGFDDFLYVHDRDSDGGDRVSRIDPNGLTTELASGFHLLVGMEFGPRGAFGDGLYLIHGSLLSHIDAQGADTLLTMGVDRLDGLSFGFDDLLYTGHWPGGLDVIDSSGTATSLVAVGTMTRIVDVRHATSAAYGHDLFVLDGASGRPIWRVRSNGDVSLLTKLEFTGHLLAFGKGGVFGFDLYVNSYQGPAGIFTVAPDGTISAFATGFSDRGVAGIAFGKGGAFGRDMYVVEYGLGRVVRIGPKRSLDCNENSVPDECETDCDQNGQVDSCDLAAGLAPDCNANLVPDSCDIADGTSTDCNADGVPDSCELAQNPGVDCNGNGTHDSCDIADGTSDDCNANGTPDACELAELFVADCNANSIPDECEGLSSAKPEPELIGVDVSVKNRFLSFRAGGAGQDQAVRVTFESLPPPFDLWNGAEMWVGPTSQVNEAGADVIPSGGPTFTAASLRCTPLFTDWSVEGMIHVFHEGIVPDGSYRVDVIDQICDTAVETNFSEALPVTTAIWGDTVLDLSVDPPPPPDGANNIDDALAVLERFSNAPGAIIKARADLEPACLDLKINVTDVLASLAGFVGVGYPFTPTAADPCNSTCPNPLP